MWITTGGIDKLAILSLKVETLRGEGQLDEYLTNQNALHPLPVRSVEDIVARKYMFRYGIRMIENANRSHQDHEDCLLLRKKSLDVRAKTKKWIEKSFNSLDLDIAIMTSESGLLSTVPTIYALAVEGWPLLTVPLGFDGADARVLYIYSPPNTDGTLLQIGSVLESFIAARRTPADVNPDLRTKLI